MVKAFKCKIHNNCKELKEDGSKDNVVKFDKK